MNIPRTFLLTLLASLAPVRADFVIVQQVDGLGQQSGNVTLKLKDGKARAELAPQVTHIIDGTTGDTITLMHGPKTFMRVPAAQGKALVEQMQKIQAGGSGAAPSAKPVATGQTEGVGQWAAEIFTWSSGALSARYWVARDFPNYAAVQAAMDKVQSGGVAGMTKGMLPATSDFPGMVVKTEIKMKQKTITSMIASVTEQPVDAKEFEVPEGYRELPSPELGTPAPPEK